MTTRWITGQKHSFYVNSVESLISIQDQMVRSLQGMFADLLSHLTSLLSVFLTPYPSSTFSLNVLDNCARLWHVISQKPLTLCPSQIRSVFNRQLISLLPLWLSFSPASWGNAQLYIINLTALPSATIPSCHEVYRSHGPALSAYKEQSKQPAAFHVALMVLTLIYKVTKESLCMCTLFASFAKYNIAQNNIVEKKKSSINWLRFMLGRKEVNLFHEALEAFIWFTEIDMSLFFKVFQSNMANITNLQFLRLINLLCSGKNVLTWQYLPLKDKQAPQGHFWPTEEWSQFSDGQWKQSKTATSNCTTTLRNLRQ